MDFTINPDIRRAATLPARVYSDPGVFARLRERVFARSWHLVGHERLLREPGAYAPLTLLPGVLNEPLMLTRDEKGVLHALSNVCTHRGAIIADEPGCAQSLRCRYHGRRFGIDGRFLSMPEFEEAADFPSAADNLREVPLGNWRGFLFVSLDPAMPFDEWIAPMSERLAWAPVERAEFDSATSRAYEVNANWALYVDNYLEGFHVPFVHATLAATLDYTAYTTALVDHAVLQLGVAKPGEPAFERPDPRIAGYYWWLFPTTMFNVYPWGLSVNIIRPLAPDRTSVVYEFHVWDAAQRGAGAGSGLDRVELEDEAVVESVQRGVRSRLYERGRYSPTREAGVHHFHRMLADALTDDRNERPEPRS